MKFTLLTAIAAGAALVQVGASPLRVMVVTTTTNQGQSLPPNFRFGHAVPNNNANPNIAMVLRPAVQPPNNRSGRPSCRGARFRQKAVEMSNAFRKALGWPLIETSTTGTGPHFDHPLPPPPAYEPGRVHILPFIGTPNAFVEEGRVRPHPSALPNPYLPHPHPHPHPHHGYTHGRIGHVHGFRNAPFVQRLHVALMALGPWEGRAVAFVLGCGIGVLLRMLWVLAIVSYRLIKGPKEDEHKYTEIFVVEEYEDGLTPATTAAPPAPPTYTYTDEKQADKKDAEPVVPVAN